MAAAGRPDIVSNIFSLSVEISNEELDEIVEQLSLRDFREFLTRLKTELPSESTDDMMSDLIGNFPQAYGHMYVPRNYPVQSQKMRSLVWVYFFIMIKFLRAKIYPKVLRGRKHLHSRVYGVNSNQRQLQRVVSAFADVNESKIELNKQIAHAEKCLWDYDEDYDSFKEQGGDLLKSVKTFIPIFLENISPYINNEDSRHKFIETTLKKNLTIIKEKSIIIIFGEELANRPKTPVRVQEEPDKTYKLVQYFKNEMWQDCSKDIFIKASYINLTSGVRAVTRRTTRFAPTLRF